LRKNKYLLPIIMKFGTFFTLLALPVALLAKDDSIVNKAEPLTDQSEATKAIELTDEVDEKASLANELTETASITESEFSGNPAIDSTDAGNIDAPGSSIKESKEEEDAVAAADTESEGDSATAEDGKEMSQEEADAEVESAMGSDSATVDSALSAMQLDMKAAAIPTYSRRISSPYGIRTYRMHRGVDLGLCHGEDRTIVAAFPGKVKLVRNQGRRRGYGKYVILDHGNGLTTLYAHLASWKVNIGDEVQAGDTIGIGGNSGRSFGAHLHFEIKYKGLHVNPATVFNFQDSTYVNEVAVLDPAALQATEDEFQKELAKHRYYKVRRGDCLGKIARRYGISVGKLKKLNGLKSNRIRPGQVLRCS